MSVLVVRLAVYGTLHLRRRRRRLGLLEFLKLHAGCSIRKISHAIRLPESTADVVIRTHDQAWSEVDFP